MGIMDWICFSRSCRMMERYSSKICLWCLKLSSRSFRLRFFKEKGLTILSPVLGGWKKSGIMGRVSNLLILFFLPFLLLLTSLKAGRTFLKNLFPSTVSFSWLYSVSSTRQKLTRARLVCLTLSSTSTNSWRTTTIILFLTLNWSTLNFYGLWVRLSSWLCFCARVRVMIQRRRSSRINI